MQHLQTSTIRWEKVNSLSGVRGTVCNVLHNPEFHIEEELGAGLNYAGMTTDGITASFSPPSTLLAMIFSRWTLDFGWKPEHSSAIPCIHRLERKRIWGQSQIARTW